MWTSAKVAFCSTGGWKAPPRFLGHVASVQVMPRRYAIAARSGDGIDDGGPSSRGQGFGGMKPDPLKNSVSNSFPERSETAAPVGKRTLKDLASQIPYGTVPNDDFMNSMRSSDVDDSDKGVLPQVVADRMIRRIAGFGGVPLATLFICFGAYFFAKYKYDITVIPAVVAYSTLGCIGAAGIGITYGIMSSSWDEEEGSLLGWNEAKTNVLRAVDGVLNMIGKERRNDTEFNGIQGINKIRRGKASRKSSKQERENS